MKNVSYFSTLNPTEKKNLRLQGSCNRENALNERREQKLEARNNKAMGRVQEIWRNVGTVKIHVDLR